MSRNVVWHLYSQHLGDGVRTISLTSNHVVCKVGSRTVRAVVTYKNPVLIPPNLKKEKKKLQVILRFPS